MDHISQSCCYEIVLDRNIEQFEPLVINQVVEDPVVLVTASVDMSVCFWKPDGERAGLIDLKRSFYCNLSWSTL